MFSSTRAQLAFADLPADDFLTFNRHVSATVAMLDDGSHFAMVRLRGKPLAWLDQDGRYAERRRRHAVLRGLADRDATIYEHLVCHDRVEPFRPGQFRSAYAADLARDYHARTDAGLIARDWFLTIVVRPDVTTRLFTRKRQQAESPFAKSWGLQSPAVGMSQAVEHQADRGQGDHRLGDLG